MKEYIKPDLEVVKIRVEENFADNTTRYNLNAGGTYDSLALSLDSIQFSPYSS